MLAPSALDTLPIIYRLGYSDAQQLRPYAQARWSMPPAQLLRQRVRETLGQRRAVLNLADGVLAPPGTSRCAWSSKNSASCLMPRPAAPVCCACAPR